MTNETMPIKIKLTLAAIALLTACAPRSFQVRPAQPHYIVQAPDRTETTFPDVARKYGDQFAGWVTLGNRMVLKIESAYFEQGAAKRDISTYVGVESQTLESRPNGQLRPTGLVTLPNRPQDQPAVASLLPARQQKLRSHRFFFQVAMNRTDGKSSAVLLSARSSAEMERLATTLLQNPRSVCRNNTPNCTVFPDGCAVSLGLGITLNNKPATIPWGSSLGNVVREHRPFTIQRLHKTKLYPITIDITDREALRLPILPGDSIAW